MSARQLLVGSQAKPRKKQHTSPCSDCPWARKALPGWLGNSTADEWLATVHGEALIECHTTDKQCAGAAIFRGNVCKVPRDPNILTLPADRVKVFSWNKEFKDHHEKGSINATT